MSNQEAAETWEKCAAEYRRLATFPTRRKRRGADPGPLLLAAIEADRMAAFWRDALAAEIREAM